MLSPVFKGCAWFRLNWRPSKLLSARKKQKKKRWHGIPRERCQLTNQQTKKRRKESSVLSSFWSLYFTVKIFNSQVLINLKGYFKNACHCSKGLLKNSKLSTFTMMRHVKICSSYSFTTYKLSVYTVAHVFHPAQPCSLKLAVCFFSRPKTKGFLPKHSLPPFGLYPSQ